MMKKRLASAALVTVATGALLVGSAGTASATCDCGTGAYVGQNAYQGSGNNISVYSWNGSSWVYQGQYNVRSVGSNAER